MKIISILQELIEEHKDNMIVRKNGTMLLNPGKIPKCEYMIFPPLSREFYQMYLVDAYKNRFPSEYLRLLEHFNGANLCTVRLKTPNSSFACSLLVIFGLPITPPFARAADMEEPYDIRIEDLDKHRKIPKTWMKCGVFYKDYNFDERQDIYIDTTTGQVFSCVNNRKKVTGTWETLDECLCDIFNSMADRKEEYDF